MESGPPILRYTTFIFCAIYCFLSLYKTRFLYWSCDINYTVWSCDINYTVWAKIHKMAGHGELFSTITQWFKSLIIFAILMFQPEIWRLSISKYKFINNCTEKNISKRGICHIENLYRWTSRFIIFFFLSNIPFISQIHLFIIEKW